MSIWFVPFVMSSRFVCDYTFVAMSFCRFFSFIVIWFFLWRHMLSSLCAFAINDDGSSAPPQFSKFLDPPLYVGDMSGEQCPVTTCFSAREALTTGEWRVRGLEQPVIHTLLHTLSAQQVLNVSRSFSEYRRTHFIQYMTLQCSHLYRHYTGWPKKVSHYRESSLNRIKNRQPG